MLIVRLAKILMIATVGAFAFMVTYDNIVDYGSNYEFVRHVLSMDTTFSGNALMDRAVTDARVWKGAYAAIIAGFTRDEQTAMFSKNAERLFRI